MNRSWGVAALWLGMFATWVHAADISYDIQPQVLRVGEAATATISISGMANPPAPSFPQVEGVEVTATGKRSSRQVVNGQHSSSITYTFRLVPTKTGKISIRPFTYAIGGQTVTLPAKQMEAVAQGEGRFSGQGQPQLKDVLFAKLEVEKAEVYNQDFFDVYLSVYHRSVQLGRQFNPSNFPEGLSVQPLQQLGATREVVDGQIFQVERFRARVHAITAGTFTLQPTVGLQLVVQQNNRRNSFNFFFGGAQMQPVQVATEPIQIKVLPLPTEGRPPDFSGAVGSFAFDVQVVPTQVTAGDPVTITTTISGKGNISSISAPQIILGDHFRVYEPKLAKQEMAKDQSQGLKAFEQVIIPRSEQASELPSLRFSYFDPVNKKYTTLTRGPFPLQVIAAPDSGLRTVESTQAPWNATTRPLGRDIVYLKDAPEAWSLKGQASWYTAPTFVAVQAIPLLLLGIVSLLARRRDTLADDVAKARRLHAPKSAREGLRRARTALSENDKKDFYEALWDALASYFGDRLNLGPGDVTQDIVVAAVTRGGLDAEDIHSLQDLFRTCEQERFGASSENTVEERQSLLDKLTHLLRRCEKVRV